MFTMVTQGSRRMVSAAAAVAVVAFGGLVMNQGHLGGLPEGSISVGELTAVDVMQMAAITLPEVTVTARRPTAGQRQVASRRGGEGRPAVVAGGRATLGSGEAPGMERSPSGSVLLK